jgi:hypothetical protein
MCGSARAAAADVQGLIIEPRVPQASGWPSSYCSSYLSAVPALVCCVLQEASSYCSSYLSAMRAAVGVCYRKY